MSNLIATGAPSNLDGVVGHYVESDMFDICGRIAEISPRLRIWVHEDGREKPFVILERIPETGKEEMVFRTDVLDGRVLEEIRYIQAVPYAKRYAIMEAREDAAKKKQEQDGLDGLVERIGLPMRRELERCGFIGSRGTSYAKRSRVAQRARA